MKIKNEDTVFVGSATVGAAFGFTCKICDGIQNLEANYNRANAFFPVCDNCLKDLKEFVLSKRDSTNLVCPVCKCIAGITCAHDWHYGRPFWQPL